MNKRVLIAMAALSLLATGCYQNAAEQTVGSAYTQACKGNVAKLAKLLTGDALTQYANVDGARQICEKYAAAVEKKNLKLETKLVAEANGPDGRAALRTYGVDVLNDARTLGSASVNCAVTWAYVRNGSNTPYCFFDPRYGTICQPYPYPGYPGDFGYTLVDYEDCKVQDLK